MREKFRNLLEFSLGNVFRYLLIFLNFMGFIFVCYHLYSFDNNVVNHVFSYYLGIIFVVNCSYAACVKTKWGLYYLLYFAGGMLAVFIGNYLATLPMFYLSVSYLTPIVIISFLLFAEILAFRQIMQIKDREVRHKKARRIVLAATFAALCILLIVFIALTVDSLFNYKKSVFEMVTGGLLFYMIFIDIAVMLCIMRLIVAENSDEAFRKHFKINITLMVVSALLGCFSLAGLLVPLVSIPDTVERANRSYAQAFGDEFLHNGNEYSSFRSLQFSLADYIFGIRTDGYEKKMDIEYYNNGAVSLAYDAYFPKSIQSFSGYLPVLVRLHGETGDKGYGNYAQPNKYFASKGFIVFDIQYGDSNEKKGRNETILPNKMEEQLWFMDKFFSEAKIHFPQADWDCVFLSGEAYGGTLAIAYGLDAQRAPQIRVRGIIPFYPYIYTQNEAPYGDCRKLITPNSPPILIYMGTHDGYIDKKESEDLIKAYHDMGIDEAAIIYLDFAGHGSDGYFCGHHMQIFLYYMERFLGQYRSL